MPKASDISNSPEARHAEPPRPPALGPAALQAQEEHRDYLRQREGQERRSVLRGLILLAVIVLLVSFLRAGSARVFPSGWWRSW